MKRIIPYIHWGITSLPLFLLLGVFCIFFSSEMEVQNFFAVHRAGHPTLALVLKLMTDWGNVAFYIFFVFILCCAVRQKDKATCRFVFIWLGAQLIIALVCTQFAKITIGRPRPGNGEWFLPLSSRGSFHSLPSGHTTEFTGSAMTVSLGARRIALSVFMGLLLMLMGFSRIYLGWHHPSDVFFGWLLGSVTGLAVTVFAPPVLRSKEGK